jgi:hypothetical protein
MGCMRLLKLLKAAGSETGQLEAYLKETAEQALESVMKELGISE